MEIAITLFVITSLLGALIYFVGSKAKESAKNEVLEKEKKAIEIGLEVSKSIEKKQDEVRKKYDEMRSNSLYRK